MSLVSKRSPKPIALTSAEIGVTSGHAGEGPRPVTAFALAAGELTAIVWDYGAHLVSLTAPDRAGTGGPVVWSPGGLAAYEGADRGGYPGATVGRFANRIAGGRFELDGVTHQLATNDGPNHLHGGRIGFDQYVWSAVPFEDSRSCGVRLSLQRPDGDEGYPGTLSVGVTYRLDDTGALAIEYQAETDAPTIVNLTNHTYWNLAGGGPILDHELRLGAQRYLAVDEVQIPTGGPAVVAGTRFDFGRRRPIGDEFDHCFLVDEPEAAAVLGDPVSGRFMRIETDQPGLQVYTANHLGPPHAGICLEAQQLPDAPNRPDFPSTVLRPGEIYRQRTVHHFGAE